MIKLICPKCMKPVPIAEDFTGREVTCPACAAVFDAPARYTPAVLSDPSGTATTTPAVPEPPVPVAPLPPAVPTRPAAPPVAETGGLTSSARPDPPPGFVPPMAPPPAPVAYTPPPAPPPIPVQSPQLPGGYTKTIGFTISPKVVAWLPAVLLTITFLTTFFPWIGSYHGGYPVHSQSPWRAIVGSVSRNFKLEQKVPEWLDKVSSDWALMVPFVLLLVLALAFAWVDRGMQSIDTRKMPQLAKLWPWRKPIVCGVAAFALLLMLIQVSSGFGMERAIREAVRDDPLLAQEREAARNGPAPLAALATVKNKEEAKLAEYNLERTWWQDLGLACNLLAVVAVFLSIRLDQRGDKPPPKLMLHY